ncbi:hypothetical protein BROUX41_000557 [Berkeleyomyces rouxiae]|uniref:uncharacterized protein n=1 Tax=Berkeleyomyces rouxiae TaxID=2035830 RepID=UPI003B781029
MNYAQYAQGSGHPIQFGGMNLSSGTFQQAKVQGDSDVGNLLPPDQGGVPIGGGPNTAPMSMVPSSWRSPVQDHRSILKPDRSSIGSVGNVSWDNEMEQHSQGPIINVPHFQSRICPFAHYNPVKYNRNEWAHCHNPQEKNGDIVVHLQRHHRLIRSQRKADKTGRKNGHGQSYIAICSGENFNERGDSQCRECESFERIVDSGPGRKDDWNSHPHRISAICQKCWFILHDRDELAAHLQENCGGRAPKHLEKWQLELEAFCINPEWIEPPPPGTQSPLMTSPPPDLHSSMASHASVSVPLRSNVGPLDGGDGVSNMMKAPITHGNTLPVSHPHTTTMKGSNDMGYSDTEIIESYKNEIEKLRLHLYFLVNHPQTTVSQSIQQMYQDRNCYDITPPRKLDLRIEPPGIQWTPPYALITGSAMSSSTAYMPMGPGPNNEPNEYLGPPATHPGH